MRRSVFGWAGGLAVAALAATTLWAETPPARPPALQAVVDCRKIDDSAQRLACYDNAVADMAAAEDKGDLVSLDRAQRQAARRQTFGFALPTLGFLDKGEAVDRVAETVESVSRTVDGRWELHLQGGAVWRQTDDADLSRTPHPGSLVVIMKAALGSFMMKIDGQQAIRVHRDS